MKIFSLLADNIKNTFKKNKPEATSPANASGPDVQLPKDRTSTMHITQAYVETMSHAIVKQLEYLEHTKAVEHIASRHLEQKEVNQIELFSYEQQEAACNQKLERTIREINSKQANARKQYLESYQNKFHQQKQSFQQYIQGQLETINQLKQQQHKQQSSYNKLKTDHSSCYERLEKLKTEHQQLQDNLAALQISEGQHQLNLAKDNAAKNSATQVIAFEKIQQLKSVRQDLEQRMNANSSLEQALRNELGVLQKEAKKLQNNSADQLTSHLKALGVVGISYQPKEGHLTIPAEELQNFVKNPGSYSVSHSGISESTYKSWQAHCQSPQCTAILSNGSVCGEGIEAVTDPLRFVIGISDRCQKHKRKGYLQKK